LPRLRYLSLDGMPVDLSLLASLVTLESLILTNTPVKDFSPLAALPRLNHLGLDDATIAELGSLARLKAIRTLRIHGVLIEPNGLGLRFSSVT